MKHIYHYFIYSLAFVLCLTISHKAQATCGEVQAGQPELFVSPICNLSEAVEKPSSAETNATNYAFLVTDSQTLDENGDPVIIGVSEDGIFDFIDHPAGTYCFYGIAYNQADLDELGEFLNLQFALPAELVPEKVPIPFLLEHLIKVLEKQYLVSIPLLIDALNLPVPLEVCYAIVEEPQCIERKKAACCEASLSGEKEIYIGENVTLIANMIDGTPPYTYEWSTGAIAEQMDSATLNIKPLKTTTYEVNISDAGGCTANSSFTVLVYKKRRTIPLTASDFYQLSPSINNIPQNIAMAYTSKTATTNTLTPSAKEFFVNIFPNPSKNKLQIAANLPSQSATYTLNLRNITGQKIIEQQLTTTQLRQHQIDISQLKTGIYWLQINDGKELWTKKVMILD